MLLSVTVLAGKEGKKEVLIHKVPKSCNEHCWVHSLGIQGMWRNPETAGRRRTQEQGEGIVFPKRQMQGAAGQKYPHLFLSLSPSALYLRLLSLARPNRSQLSRAGHAALGLSLPEPRGTVGIGGGGRSERATQRIMDTERSTQAYSGHPQLQN